jgi:hypothetical protein
MQGGRSMILKKARHISLDIAKIRGYIGLSLLGKTEKFSRVSK